MSAATPRQRCPNCGHLHDVSVYVTGQRILCRCKLHFEVQRPDVRPTSPPSSAKISTRQPNASPENQSAILAAAGGDDVDHAPTVLAKAIEIPGYELLELVGRGGMGEVWKARQQSLNRVVAIKLLAAKLSQGVEYVRRFEKEATALAALAHPNIVQIIDRGSCASDQTWFLVMEFCEGHSLRQQLAAKALSISQRLSIMVQVGKAIDYAHQRGIIHRDLKPENILVDEALKAKVVDFGLAGMRGAEGPEQNLTGAAMAMGTLNYMAPEQRRDARSVDERADVYSLGIILYEVLVGEVPVGRFKLPSERVAGIDPRFDQIVARALAPEPSARYANAGAMTLEIEALLGAVSSSQELPTQLMAPAASAHSSQFDSLPSLSCLKMSSSLARQPKLLPLPPPIQAVPGEMAKVESNGQPAIEDAQACAPAQTGQKVFAPASVSASASVSAPVSASAFASAPADSSASVPVSASPPASASASVAASAPAPVAPRASMAQAKIETVAHRIRRSAVWIVLLIIISIIVGVAVLPTLSSRSSTKLPPPKAKNAFAPTP